MALCLKCCREINISDLVIRKRPTHWFATYCVSCNQAQDKQIRPVSEETKLKNAQARKKRIDEITTKVINYLKDHPCVDCGTSDFRTLEFDHQLNKKFNISSMIQNNSWELICEEIIKCEVRCANCHRIKTHKERNTRKHRLFDTEPKNVIE